MKRLLLIGLLLLTIAVPLTAQDIEPVPDVTVVDPNLTITWPPPVYVGRGQIEIRGTANLPEMTNFFIEFRPLNLIPGADEVVENPWLPATIASAQPVVDGVLGVWDTVARQIDDGLYELRLTANTAAGTPQFARLSPLRVENEGGEFSIFTIFDEMLAQQPVVQQPPTNDQQQPAQQPPPAATQPPPPTAAPTGPVLNITHETGANVRIGPDTLFALLGAFPSNTEHEILAVNPAGDWYKIRYYNAEGWVWAPLVSTSGNLSALPVDAGPPTPVPTPTVLPTATPVPSNINLEVANIQINPHPLTCNQSSEIQVTVRNTGSEALATGGRIRVVAILNSTGAQLAQTETVFAPIGPGQQTVASAFLTVATNYAEIQRIEATVDSDNVFVESNESDNTSSAGTEYILAKGGCP